MSALFLRIGLAFSFLYPVFASFENPQNWIGFFPQFLRTWFGDSLLLVLFSGYEIFLALWLLWGRWLVFSSLLAFITLAGIVVFNFGAIDIVFRDIGLAFSAISLAFFARPVPVDKKA